MSLEVIDVNGLATIQDSGRVGWKRFGVPAAGPMDSFAFRAANLLAANESHAALIEIGLGDITLRVLHDCVIAVCGVGYSLSIYVWDFPLWSSYYVRAGWTIHLNRMEHGLWCYLAIAGRIRTQPVLGSCSTDLRGHFGGFDGRALRAGDRIERADASRPSQALAARSLPKELLPAYAEHPTLDVIMGPQQNYFTEQSVDQFLSSEYSLSLTSDRSGYRLAGPPLMRRRQRELISEGMTAGAIEAPANGQPIVLMADCPTAGGYPKIASVISADLPLLAQCTPNRSRIRFQATTVARAQKKYRDQMNALAGGIVEAEA